MMTNFTAMPNAVTALTTAYQWEKMFAAAGIWDGIDGNDLLPTPNVSTHSVSIAPGTCIIKGQVWHTDVATGITPSVNTAAAARPDRVVLQYDRDSTTAAAIVQLLLVQGNPGDPAPPALVQTGAGTAGTGKWQIPVCQWVMSGNSGVMTSFQDTRQLSGRTVATILSGARPGMTYSRLGIEVDTGYLLLYDQNVPGWRNIGPKNQVETSGNFVNGTSTAGYDLHAAFTIPPNDVANAALNAVGYRLRCGGGGHQSAKAVATFVFMTNAFGLNWGATSAGQIIPINGAFNWHYDVELVVNANGSGSVYGDLTITQALANPGNNQSVYVLNHQQAVNTVDVSTSRPMSVKAYVSASDAGGTSPPSLQCVGATFERIAN